MKTSILMIALAALVAACATAPARTTPAASHPAPPAQAAPGRAVAPRPTPEAVTAKTLHGGWQATGLDFETITVDKDGTFASHLHSRPFATGTWRLQGGILTLAAKGLGDIVIKALEKKGDVLHGQSDGSAVTLQRIP